MSENAFIQYGPGAAVVVVKNDQRYLGRIKADGEAKDSPVPMYTVAIAHLGTEEIIPETSMEPLSSLETRDEAWLAQNSILANQLQGLDLATEAEIQRKMARCRILGCKVEEECTWACFMGSVPTRFRVGDIIQLKVPLVSTESTGYIKLAVTRLQYSFDVIFVVGDLLLSTDDGLVFLDVPICLPLTHTEVVYDLTLVSNGYFIQPYPLRQVDQLIPSHPYTDSNAPVICCRFEYAVPRQLSVFQAMTVSHELPAIDCPVQFNCTVSPLRRVVLPVEQSAMTLQISEDKIVYAPAAGDQECASCGRPVDVKDTLVNPGCRPPLAALFLANRFAGCFRCPLCVAVYHHKCWQQGLSKLQRLVQDRCSTARSAPLNVPCWSCLSRYAQEFQSPPGSLSVAEALIYKAVDTFGRVRFQDGRFVTQCSTAMLFQLPRLQEALARIRAQELAAGGHAPKPSLVNAQAYNNAFLEASHNTPFTDDHHSSLARRVLENGPLDLASRYEPPRPETPETRPPAASLGELCHLRALLAARHGSVQPRQANTFPASRAARKALLELRLQESKKVLQAVTKDIQRVQQEAELLVSQLEAARLAYFALRRTFDTQAHALASAREREARLTDETRRLWSQASASDAKSAPVPRTAQNASIKADLAHLQRALSVLLAETQ